MPARNRGVERLQLRFERSRLGDALDVGIGAAVAVVDVAAVPVLLRRQLPVDVRVERVPQERQFGEREFNRDRRGRHGGEAYHPHTASGEGA